MWVAWLNIEVILGGFMETTKEALRNGVGIEVYFRIA